MLLSVLHRTTFLYAGAAHDSFNEVRLRPVDDASQTCRSFDLATEPAAAMRDYLDFYGNRVHYFDVTGRHETLVITASSEVETTPNGARPPVPEVTLSQLETSGELDGQAEFLADSRYVPLDVQLWKEAQDTLAGGRRDLWADTRRLCRHVYTTFRYKPESTGVNTLATDALRLRCGVCQDFAHVALGLCRTSGIPARYVSGYFFNPDLPVGEEEASHAWIEVFIPGYGWAGYDPTHDRSADQRYVKLASGRDYADIRPVNGTYRGAPARDLRVEVKIREARTVFERADSNGL
jgi:transglutaminase-like putative cysteine protease